MLKVIHDLGKCFGKNRKLLKNKRRREKPHSRRKNKRERKGEEGKTIQTNSWTTEQVMLQLVRSSSVLI